MIEASSKLLGTWKIFSIQQLTSVSGTGQQDGQWPCSGRKWYIFASLPVLSDPHQQCCGSSRFFTWFGFSKFWFLPEFNLISKLVCIFFSFKSHVLSELNIAISHLLKEIFWSFFFQCGSGFAFSVSGWIRIYNVAHQSWVAIKALEG